MLISDWSSDVCSSDLIAYFGAAGFVPAPALLEALRGRPALTITDTAAGTSGGVVHFLLDGGRVRFEIDARLAALNGLPISSRVLELALREIGRAARREKVCQTVLISVVD